MALSAACGARARCGDEARPQNANDTTVAVDTKKSRAFEEVYEDDLDQMTVDRKQAVAMRSSKALGRVHDKTIIRAINASTQVVGDPTEFFSVNVALKARQVLMANEVDIQDGNTFCAMDSVSWTLFTADKRVATQDYTGPMLPFTKGKLALTWNGVHYFQLSDAILRENDDAEEVTALMWHRSAMGFGYVRQLTGSVDWDNRKDCWTHNMRMRIGSKLLLPEGAVKIMAKYDADTMVLPTP